MKYLKLGTMTIVLSIILQVLSANDKPRARDLGVPFDGKPGKMNAITDVEGVKVGHSTIIKGNGKLKVGKGPVRTGVTAVLPRGDKSYSDPVFAGWYSLNGNGEMTGTTWVEESGFLEGPVMITNTHSVGIVRDAVISWRVNKGGADASGYWWSLPVVAETYDGFLNDINGFHVKEEHAHQALSRASTGSVEEGGVGGGTGMICHSFKGGIGTSSRIIEVAGETYTLGALVQANYGAREDLMVSGVPVGKEITDLQRVRNRDSQDGDGSIIVIVATDAPLVAHQCKRLARRIPLGIARVGTVAHNGSGDIFITFSTANPGAANAEGTVSVNMVPNGKMNPLFKATVQATEEAIINALVAAEDMVGVNGNTVYALPHDRLRAILKKYNRLSE
ncbi:MAG TPA: S58 family peptidase [Candidatus Marinimicrobia bacterium]|nr:S58 family peptidase [Candidatus Neomarinimicrobiota bacterium]HIC74200.1 S58 family peptidase [Candidatus Neomarinimicrobiota bacterium]